MPVGDETIFLVEDDKGAHELARRVLSSLAYTLLETRDGQEALQLAADYPGSIPAIRTTRLPTTASWTPYQGQPFK